jgi:hypothetical protein
MFNLKLDFLQSIFLRLIIIINCERRLLKLLKESNKQTVYS